MCVVYSSAQTITPSVINSAGGSGTIAVGGNTYEVYYNIGETFVTTLTNTINMVTQGFLQPDTIINQLMTITPIVTNETCIDSKDGSVKLEIVSHEPTGYIKYVWYPTSICPDSTCTTIEDLAPGIYTVQVVKTVTAQSTSTTLYTYTFTVNASQDVCSITIYNGLTPNGDGFNDVFYIENIANFPDNHVTIYNRWGQLLYETKNYDNVDKCWKGTVASGTQTAPSGTYFYIIDLNNGAKLKKGWIELTTNK